MVIYKRALAIYAEALWLRLILYNKKIFLLYKMSRKMNIYRDVTQQIFGCQHLCG